MLSLVIEEVEDTKQVKCLIDGILIQESYGFTIETSDEDIEIAVVEDLTAKNYERLSD